MKEVFWEHIGTREVSAGGFATKKKALGDFTNNNQELFFLPTKIEKSPARFWVLMILPSNLRIPPINMDTMRISPMAWVGISIKLEVCGCNPEWRFKSFYLMFGPKTGDAFPISYPSNNAKSEFCTLKPSKCLGGGSVFFFEFHLLG